MKRFLFGLMDIMIYWTVPFAIVLFFKLVTLNSFAYHDVITSVPFIVFTFLYSLLMAIMYLCGDPSMNILSRDVSKEIKGNIERINHVNHPAEYIRKTPYEYGN